MVICSCNKVDTAMIKECLTKNPEATTQDVVKQLGWLPECSACVYNLVETIEEIRNGN